VKAASFFFAFPWITVFGSAFVSYYILVRSPVCSFAHKGKADIGD
jgi:hypothetical protein